MKRKLTARIELEANAVVVLEAVEETKVDDGCTVLVALFNGEVLIEILVTCAGSRVVLSGLGPGGGCAGTWSWFAGRRII